VATVGESAEVGEKVGVREHADNLITFAILVTILVTVMQNVGRLVGKRLGSAGLTAFFGG
jgi:hypothetical protein